MPEETSNELPSRDIESSSPEVQREQFDALLNGLKQQTGEEIEGEIADPDEVKRIEEDRIKLKTLAEGLNMELDNETWLHAGILPPDISRSELGALAENLGPAQAHARLVYNKTKGPEDPAIEPPKLP